MSGLSRLTGITGNNKMLWDIFQTFQENTLAEHSLGKFVG